MIYHGEMSMPEIECWHRIILENKPTGPDFHAMEKWCDDYEGKGKYALGRTAFWFQHSEDAIIFALRWK